MQEVKNSSTLNVTELIHVATIRSTDGTNTPSLGGINGTNPPSLENTDGTTVPSFEFINGTYKKMTCAKETLQLSCAANELIVIEDIFYGRRENGPRCGCTTRDQSCDKCQGVDESSKADLLSYIRKLCQGLQQCDEQPENVYAIQRCPSIKKYLEVTYHCEEVKKNVTFQKDPGQLDTSDTWEWGALAVSSTNEIFVTDERNKSIQVFSMKGVFIRSFSTRDLKPVAISTGRNDTLWVVLEGYDIQQHSKEGHVLAKFTCSSTSKEIIYGIAWHELSDRIILTQGTWPTEIVWLSPTYTTTPTCNLNRLSGTGSDEISNKQSITIDTKGNIYVIDESGSRILKYGENGDQLLSFGSPGSGAGNLNDPSGICVDSLGRVIVADTGNSRVEMFTAKGEHIRTIAYIHRPKYVATGGEGQLVVLNQESFVTIFPKY
ncbi:uncharacterized protein LOC144927325 [Branchiostoma floridae x Branchiostoma belcheri]